MDFTFFESLSKQEADSFLHNYLSLESLAATEMGTEAEKDEINTDFSIQSTPKVLKWILEKVKTIPKEIDSSLPAWIRESNTYLNGLKDFDETSKVLVLRASYYLGESFVRFSDKLSWATGSLETAEQNMPVITGFSDGMEMAPMLVAENLFLRIIVDEAPYGIIDKAIESWLSVIPSS